MHTSEPVAPPTNSLAEPTVWFHDPAERSGWSLVMAPDDEAVRLPSFAVAWEASYSASAFCSLALPAACVVETMLVNLA